MFGSNIFSRQTFAFGDFEAVIGRRYFELKRNGVDQPLGPAMEAALTVLLKNKGRAVPDNELIRKIWPDDESAGNADIEKLRVLVSKLRVKIDHTDENPIVVHKRGIGYQFVA